MAPPATHAVNAYLYNTLPFDMEKSFAPITMVALLSQRAGGAPFNRRQIG